MLIACDTSAQCDFGACGDFQCGVDFPCVLSSSPIDEYVDERRDPVRATDAALDYLQWLHDRFDSWYLAAAAYNGGEGRVSRGIRRLSGADSISDATFFDLSNRRYLRRETRDYVPKLIAAARIAKEPLRFAFDSIPYLQPLLYDEITVPDATGLDVLARLADSEREARFDLVVLDPPPFARSQRTLERAMRGYKEIHLRALRLLDAGGILVTYTCSHHFGRDAFLALIGSAAQRRECGTAQGRRR